MYGAIIGSYFVVCGGYLYLVPLGSGLKPTSTSEHNSCGAAV
jgi:hypothetical protein